MKVGVYRKFYGQIPKNEFGQPRPKSEWLKTRPFSWAARWFDSEGKRHSKSFKTRKEADHFAEMKQLEVRQRKAEPQPSITMQEFAREHAVVMKGQVAPGSLYDQSRALRMFLAHVGGNRKLQDVKPWDAEAFVAKRLQEGVSVATVNKDIRTLKRIFNLAIEPRGYLLEGRNPFARVKQRRYCPKPIRYVTPAEFQALTDAASSLWWKALLTVAYTTGARLGEILHLTWADVDFETSRIRICRKVSTHGAAAWEPKDRAERLLPVPSRAMQFLVDLQAVSEVGNSNVFISLTRGQHLQRRRTKGQWDERQCPVNNFTRDFKSFVRRAGVGQCSFHDLRRSCITNWARALPIHVVRQLAGHSDMKTTQTYYLSVQEDDLERARGIQSQILETSATDPLLTHSAQKRSINGPAGHGEKSQLPPE
jgi:integrase